MRYRRILAENLTRLREERGMSRKQLVDRAGVSLDWIGMIERGHVNPTLDVIVEIAIALKVPPAQLITPIDD